MKHRHGQANGGPVQWFFCGLKVDAKRHSISTKAAINKRVHWEWPRKMQSKFCWGSKEWPTKLIGAECSNGSSLCLRWNPQWTGFAPSVRWSFIRALSCYNQRCICYFTDLSTRLSQIALSYHRSLLWFSRRVNRMLGGKMYRRQRARIALCG